MNSYISLVFCIILSFIFNIYDALILMKVTNIILKDVLIWMKLYIKYTRIHKSRALHAVPTLVCQRPSFYLKCLVKKGHNSKNIVYWVMPLVFQLHLVMMSRYSKFGVNTFNTFWVMGIKDFAWRRHLGITIVWIFLWNRQDKYENMWLTKL